MDLSRKSNETDYQYHRRLITGKLIDKTLADVDYTELSGLVYGQNYSSDVARRMMYGSVRTIQLIDESNLSQSASSEISELESKKQELEIERQKYSDQRNAYNKLLRDEARHKEIIDAICDAVKSSNLRQLQYIPPTVSDSEDDLLVSLNDIHYGANVDNHWMTYNSDVFKHMLEVYMSKVTDIGATHRVLDCYVWANGDFISGTIHKPVTVTNKENVIEQIMGVSELIACFLENLSHKFMKVHFISVAGNHSRLENKRDARIDERLDDLVEWYLRARLQNVKNVYFDAGYRLDPTLYVMDIRGKNYIGIHGDYDVSVEKLLSMIKMSGIEPYAVLTGHKHHNMYDTVQGVKVIMAGSFIGMDSYCIEKRIYGQPEQVVCVVNKNGIKCLYDVQL